jgi:hypothetical protein
MDDPVPVTAIADLIQLALAPVFLLAGIGAILNVMTHRLARVVDRSRALEAELGSEAAGERERAAAELALVDRRMNAVHLSISCCTASALFVCLVVATLFVADLADFAFGRPVAWLFILAMLLLIVGLVLFFWEVGLAMRSVRLHRRLIPRVPTEG